MIQKHLCQFARSYSQGEPNADHLLALTKFNVFQAFIQNAMLLGWSENGMAETMVSNFGMAPQLDLQIPYEARHLPPSLQATEIQRTKSHSPWIDCFPMLRVRDNLIEAGRGWNEEELFYDIMGFWVESELDVGLLVWGEPWNVSNWEITEAFLKKWYWVVRACPELMDSTNSWRSRRGDTLILRYI